MLYTLTLNPSLDYLVHLDQLRPGEVNRTAEEALYPGGKGLNVSLTLRQLGIQSTALGFSAGFTGRAVAELLAVQGIRTDFLEAQGLTRINVKLWDGTATELNGRGPNVSPAAAGALLRRLEGLSAGDFLVLAGSIPEGLPVSFYADILERLQPKGVHCAVDASGSLLRLAAAQHPFVVKPNLTELEELFGRTLSSEPELLKAAQELQAMGAGHVLVSLGAQGALLLTEQGKAFRQSAPKGTEKNPVGAGDAMLAGFLAGMLRGFAPQDALQLAVAAGSASAFSPWIPEGEAVEALLHQLEQPVRLAAQ